MKEAHEHVDICTKIFSFQVGSIGQSYFGRWSLLSNKIVLTDAKSDETVSDGGRISMIL